MRHGKRASIRGARADSSHQNTVLAARTSIACMSCRDRSWNKRSKMLRGDSEHGAAMIAAGRGAERFAESAERARQGDPMARRRLAHAAEVRALHEHRERRRTHGEKFVRAEGWRAAEAHRRGEEAMAVYPGSGRRYGRDQERREEI